MMINVRHNATVVRLGSQQLSLPSTMLPSFHAAGPAVGSLSSGENDSELESEWEMRNI